MLSLQLYLDSVKRKVSESMNFELLIFTVISHHMRRSKLLKSIFSLVFIRYFAIDVPFLSFW